MPAGFCSFAFKNVLFFLHIGRLLPTCSAFVRNVLGARSQHVASVLATRWKEIPFRLRLICLYIRCFFDKGKEKWQDVLAICFPHVVFLLRRYYFCKGDKQQNYFIGNGYGQRKRKSAGWMPLRCQF